MCDRKALQRLRLKDFGVCNRLASFLLDGIKRILPSCLEDIHGILPHLYVGVVYQGGRVAEAEESMEGLAVLCYGNYGETVLDLLVPVLFNRLWYIEEGFEEWRCEREEQLEDSEIDTVGRTQNDIRPRVIERRGGIGRVSGHCHRYLSADIGII